MTKYLNVRDLTRIACGLLDCDDPPLRDWELLKSAAMRPRAMVHGTEAYPTLHDKVAALMHSIARDRALIDGNKRLSFMAGYMMYALNGYQLVPPSVDEGEQFMLALTRGELDVPAVAVPLKDWARQR